MNEINNARPFRQRFRLIIQIGMKKVSAVKYSYFWREWLSTQTIRRLCSGYVQETHTNQCFGWDVVRWAEDNSKEASDSIWDQYVELGLCCEIIWMIEKEEENSDCYSSWEWKWTAGEWSYHVFDESGTTIGRWKKKC